jgi:shikimate kinase
MKLSFKEFLSESLDDKGTFKAIFIVGIPGAGKSHTLAKLKGAISPRVVNTDRVVEYLSKKFDMPVDKKSWPLFRDTAHRVTSATLAGYLNGVLPLFIDGTSNDVSNILSRAGILESLGYDVGMVFVGAPLEVAIARANARAEQVGRHVDAEFIKRVHDQSEENKEYFKNKFSFYKEINNVEDELTDDVLLKAFKQVQGFFSSEIQNPVGKRMREKMIEKKAKFLIPDILSKEVLNKKVESWYKD